MSAFGQLEKELRLAVRHRYRPQKTWRRPTVLAIAAALVLGGGALAATQLIHISSPQHDAGEQAPRADRAAGVRVGRAPVLGLRVADPHGGPPWGLRAFASSRGAHCLQVGQIVRGRIGVYLPASAGSPPTLRPLQAWPGGSSSLCSGQSYGGLPVVRGLGRQLVIGGSQDARRCGSGPCPITVATGLRYGMLGPEARSARLLDQRGHVLQSMRIRSGTGGAYLFAVALPIAPLQRADDAQTAFELRYRAVVERLAARGVPPARRLQEAARLMRGSVPWRGLRPGYANWTVEATFANGSRLQVAGSGRTSARLPGLPRRGSSDRQNVPSVRPRVSVERPGRYATVRVSFTAPVAIDRFDVHYTAVLNERVGIGCKTPSPGGGGQATTRNISAGETVEFVYKKSRLSKTNGRSGWCAGTITGTIGYHRPGATFLGLALGRFSFTIPSG